MSPFMDSIYKGIALFILGLSVVVIVVGILKIHELPGHIAKKRDHPQHDAIQITSVLGLLILPLWFIALIWAYSNPARIWIEPRGQYGTAPDDVTEPPSKPKELDPPSTERTEDEESKSEEAN